MTVPPWRDLRQADDALLTRMYLPEHRRLGPLRLAWHPEIPEPEWRRIRVLEDPPDLETWLHQAVDELSDETTTCSVEVDAEAPMDLEPRLRRWGFEPTFRYHWILRDLEAPIESRDAKPWTGQRPLIIRPVTAETIDPFVEVFEQGFTPEDEPEIGEGWAEAVRRMLGLELRPEARQPVRCLHFLATLDGEAVGIASLGVVGELAGFYNLAVPPPFRHRGIARRLMAHRLRQARALGARIAFLQAEDEPVYRWHLRAGYRSGPIVQGWCPVEG